MPTTPTVTLAQIKALSPCEHSWDRVSAALKAHGVKARQKITARDAADAGCTLDDLIWIASAVSRKDKDIERRLRLWMADCAARVLHIYERDYPTDARVRGAITAARQYARGEISAAARDARDAWAARAAARDAAWDAAGAAAWAAGDAAWAAAEAAGAAAWPAGAAARDAAWDAGDAAWAAAEAAGAAAWPAGAAARDAAWDAAGAAARDAGDAARDAAWDAEEKWQTERLILWLTDEPTDWPLDAVQAEAA